MRKHNEEKTRFKAVVELARVREGDRVLDLGARVNNNLRPHLPKGIEYKGIDMEGENNILWNLEQGLPPSVMDKKYDVIFMLELLGSLQNFKTLIEQCKQILRPNGRIILSTPSNIHFSRYASNSGIGSGTQYHSFNMKNIRNIANLLELEYTLRGVHIRIPYLNIFIPSRNLIYNDTFLVEFKPKINRRIFIAMQEGEHAKALIEFLERVIDKLIEKSMSVHFDIRRHPGDTPEIGTGLKRLKKRYDYITIIDGMKPNMLEDLAKARFHASIFSSTHFDAIGLGIPTVVLKLPDWENVEELVKRGDAKLIDTPEAFIETIERSFGFKIEEKHP